MKKTLSLSTLAALICAAAAAQNYQWAKNIKDNGYIGTKTLSFQSTLIEKMKSKNIQPYYLMHQ